MYIKEESWGNEENGPMEMLNYNFGGSEIDKCKFI